MSAWNCNSEKIQVQTPIGRVKARLSGHGAMMANANPKNITTHPAPLVMSP
jgi:hypothetical protein